SETDPVSGNVMADMLPLGVRRIHLDGLVPPTPSLPTAAELLTGPADHPADLTAEVVTVGTAGTAPPQPAVTLLAPFSVSPPAGVTSGSRDSAGLPPGRPGRTGHRMGWTSSSPTWGGPRTTPSAVTGGYKPSRRQTASALVTQTAKDFDTIRDSLSTPEAALDFFHGRKQLCPSANRQTM